MPVASRQYPQFGYTGVLLMNAAPLATMSVIMGIRRNNFRGNSPPGP